MTASEQGMRGRTVVVTRDEGADGPLTAELERRGARVLHWPTVRIAPPEDPAPLDAAIRDLGSYDWIAFTSARAVSAVLGRCSHESPPTTLRIAAVGAGTARALRDAGWPVDVEPEDHSSIALVRSLVEADVAGARVVFPASSLAGRGLVQGLTEAGAAVDEVVAYRTVRLPLGPEARRWSASLLEEEVGAAGSGQAEVDAICFASPSAVEAWLDGLGPVRFAEVGRRVLVAAIGATTAAALRNAGCVDLVVAEESTFPALAHTLETEFGHGRRIDT